jgi:hypothetical protein
MAYTRMSAHEINRILDKFWIYVEKQIDKKTKERITELSGRKIFKLSEKKIKEKVEYEKNDIQKYVLFKLGSDWSIYKGLDSISKIARAQDFITIDNFEAEFILKYRDMK